MTPLDTKSQTELHTISPFTIDAAKHRRFKEIAEANHRSVTAHLRFVIEQAIAEADEEQAA